MLIGKPTHARGRSAQRPRVDLSARRRRSDLHGSYVVRDRYAHALYSIRRLRSVPAGGRRKDSHAGRTSKVQLNVDRRNFNVLVRNAIEAVDILIHREKKGAVTLLEELMLDARWRVFESVIEGSGRERGWPIGEQFHQIANCVEGGTAAQIAIQETVIPRR